MHDISTQVSMESIQSERSGTSSQMDRKMPRVKISVVQESKNVKKLKVKSKDQYQQSHGKYLSSNMHVCMYVCCKYLYRMYVTTILVMSSDDVEIIHIIDFCGSLYNVKYVYWSYILNYNKGNFIKHTKIKLDTNKGQVH